MSLIYFVALILILLLRHFVRESNPRGFPNGPRLALPLIGTSYYLAGKNAMEKLQQRYGDAVGIWLGSKRAVFVFGFDLIQEVSRHEHCQDRQGYKLPIRGPLVLDGTHPGVISSEGQTWAEQRRFMLQTLRDFGFGKASMELLLEEEARMLIQDLESRGGGTAMDVKDDLVISTINTLWKIVTGERLSRSDEKLRTVYCKMERLLREANSPIGYIVMDNPLLRSLNRFLGLSRLEECFRDLTEFVSAPIEYHQKTFQAENIRDFTDAYIKQMLEKSESKEYSSFTGEHGMSNFKTSMVDLFLGGSETTSTTLNWAFLYMILNPDVQKELQAELDQVLEMHGSLPAYADRSRTPFAEAAVLETQRMANVSRLSAPHLNNGADVWLADGKYFLPRGTRVFMDMGSVMYDPKIFPNPRKFDPNRFIGQDGMFRPDHRVLPFGLGRRRCPGEGLAKPNIYIFLTRILYHFSLEPENPDKLPSMEPMLGGVSSPTPFKIRFKPRI